MATELEQLTSSGLSPAGGPHPDHRVRRAERDARRAAGVAHRHARRVRRRHRGHRRHPVARVLRRHHPHRSRARVADRRAAPGHGPGAVQRPAQPGRPARPRQPGVPVGAALPPHRHEARARAGAGDDQRDPRPRCGLGGGGRGRRPRTSPRPSVGVGRRTVLVDGTGPGGTVTRLLGWTERDGLSEALSQGLAPDPPRLVNGALAGLPSGRVPLEVVDTDRLRVVIAGLTQGDAIAIVVGGPIATSPVSLALARSVDSVVLVARRDRARREDVTLTTEALRLIGSVPAGVILAERPSILGLPSRGSARQSGRGRESRRSIVRGPGSASRSSSPRRRRRVARAPQTSTQPERHARPGDRRGGLRRLADDPPTRASSGTTRSCSTRWSMDRGGRPGRGARRGSVADGPLVRGILDDRRIEAVLHFAAYKSVEESIRPARPLLRRQRQRHASPCSTPWTAAGVGRFVFSSTCAVYGEPPAVPIDETAPTRPENPYGESKLLVERALPWFESGGIRSVSLRYFNAAGAEPRRAPRRGLGRRREPRPGGHPCRARRRRAGLAHPRDRLPDARRDGHPRLRPRRRPGRRAHPGARLPRRRRNGVDDAQPGHRRRVVRPRGRARGRERDRRRRSRSSRRASAGRSGRRLGGCRAGRGGPRLAGPVRPAGHRRLGRALASRATRTGTGAAVDATPWTPKRRPRHGAHRRLHHVAVPEADRDVHPRRARRRRSPGRPHRALPAPPRARAR